MMTSETVLPQASDAQERDDAPVTASKVADPDRALLAESVTIARPRQELYDFWRKLENLPRVMDNIESIEAIDARRSRWTVKAPAGRSVTFESLITNDRPGEEISWQSVDGSDIVHSGRIAFEDAGRRGTIVRATIAYEPPGGKIGQIVAKLFQREPRIQARRDLARFKQLMETGEVSTNARTRAMHAEQQGNDQ